VAVAVEDGWVRVRGARPRGARLTVPGDPSSAAPLLVGAALLAGSDVTVEGVLLNPLRLGSVRVLERMGVDVEVRPDAGAPGIEPSGSLRVRSRAEVAPVHVLAAEVPSLVDEVPLLALLASVAEGESRFEGLGELRVKESDRLVAIADMLAGAGVDVAVDGDVLHVRGPADLSWSPFDARGDHRIAMARALLALRTGADVEPDDAVAVSWPGFYDRLESLVRA